MDVSQYLEIFLDETKEHLQSLNTQILNLEQDPDDADTINEIFRAAHSLKGMAGTMGYKRMQALTHDLENLFTEVRNGSIKVNAGIIDVIFQCIDALEEYLSSIQQTADEGTNENAHLIKQLQAILNGEAAVASDDSSKEPAAEAVKEEANSDIPDFVLSEDEQDALKSAQESHKDLYVLSVKLQESCILKAARAFLVFKAVEDFGEIISATPDMQDIEDEKFDLEFFIIVATDNSVDKMIEAAKSVSEIAEVKSTVYKSNIAEDDSAEEEIMDSEDEVPDQSNAYAAAAVTAPVAPTPQRQQQQQEKKSGKPVANRTVRVDIEKLDVLMNLVSELIIAKNSLVSSAHTENSERNEFNTHIEYLESVTTNLHESVMKVRMVPIESVVAKFPRMIRDLSKNLGKKMELYMSGEETELDRTVVDEIGDPLMHLLRNSADHGLESAEVRAQRGKPEVGSIFLSAYQDGNNVVIEVRDDGNGINVEAVKNKAIERGIISPEQAEIMNEKDIVNLVFEAGFSTAKVVSDVSGRGVGLDVVRAKIEALSGEVEVKSKMGEGSTWIIRLPLTLAIIQALMVVVGGEKYAISLGSIQTIEDVKPEDIKTVEAKEVMRLRGNVIPIIRLNEVLDVESTRKPDEAMVVIVVKKGDKLAGLVVDELMGQQEIVIKSMGRYMTRCKIISGATILGDGEVALILDANTLI